MRKKAGCLAALGVGLAVSLAGAEPPKSEPAGEAGWLGGLFGGKPKPPEKKKVEPVTPTITVADRAAELQRLEKAYLRRMDVCDRLREIALNANDAALEADAERLLNMAMKVYEEQSRRLLGGGVTQTATDEEGAVQNTARVLRGVSPGGAVPQRVRTGGRVAPEQSASGRGGEQ